MWLEDFMQAPSEGEFIDQEASLEIALRELDYDVSPFIKSLKSR